jgi:predicted Zn finger-like uncharacterized protein
MLISCPNCTTRLQLDDAKVPARPFTVRCPKCQHIINAQPAGTAAHDGSAIAAGSDLPASTRAQRTHAPPFGVAAEEPAEVAVEPEAVGGQELLRALSALVARGAEEPGKPDGQKSRPGWDRRRALVCMGVSQRAGLAAELSGAGYEVSVAEDTAQAIRRMRDEKIDVLVLGHDFDPAEQGAAFITRELNALRPVERRRMFVVHLSASARTEDAHAAFLSNCNLVVNGSDANDLPRALDRALRDFNELYKDLNRALGVAAL